MSHCRHPCSRLRLLSALPCWRREGLPTLEAEGSKPELSHLSAFSGISGVLAEPIQCVSIGPAGASQEGAGGLQVSSPPEGGPGFQGSQFFITQGS